MFLIISKVFFRVTSGSMRFHVILNCSNCVFRFIRYCVDNEGYTGFNHADAEGEDDVVSRLASLKIHVQSESEQPACDG